MLIKYDQQKKSETKKTAFHRMRNHPVSKHQIKFPATRYETRVDIY